LFPLERMRVSLGLRKVLWTEEPRFESRCKVTPRDAMTMYHSVVVPIITPLTLAPPTPLTFYLTATRTSSKSSLWLDMHVEQRLSTPIGPESVLKFTVLLVMVPVVLAIAIAW